jgi:hypothetical protein
MEEVVGHDYKNWETKEEGRKCQLMITRVGIVGVVG